jgi:non-ribosomal peptide synthetase component F
VVVASPAQRQPGPPLTEFLTGATSEERVTVLLATPTTLRGLDPTRLTGLRLVISAGETLLPDLARAWAAGRRLVTAYGLTEGSIWSSYTDVDAASLDTRPWVPLGRPIPGCSLSLRTPTGDPVPAGSEGEVWIGGVGVAFAHYLNQPELTEQRFPHTPQGRMLRTGDYAVADPSGQLRYCGR